MEGKRIVSVGASILLLVGVCVGVIVGISHKNSNSKEDDNISINSKAVAAICAPTDHKQICIDSVRPAARNKSSSPIEFIQAAIKTTMHVVEEAMKKSKDIFNTSDPAQKMAKEDCEDLLDFAVQELQASYSMVGNSELHILKDCEAELQNWLSAVVSYQQTCLDGVTQPDLKEQMLMGLDNATQLTSNALAIVSAISGILNTFNIPQNKTASSRRLLESYETGHGEFPEWLSATGRKLLASKDNAQVKPNAVVAQDGSGQYKTIAEALAAYPKDLVGRYVIYVKAGIYNESIKVTKDQVNVFMYGDGPRKTIVTGRKNSHDGVSTYQTASFSAVGRGFIGKAMGFQNTAGSQGHQAVALRVQSDMSAFYNCRIDGHQGTLYAQTHRQFYRNCVISGTVDFIFGDAAAVVQNSLIIARKPMEGQKNTVTAHGRADKRETTGLVIQNCRIVPEQLLYPAGWLEWNGNFALDTLHYAEYANRGPGAVTDKRIKWKGYQLITDKNEALQYTAGTFIQGNQWLKDTGAPYLLSLSN